MLSDQLVRFICGHWKQISGTATLRISSDPETPHMNRLPEGEFERWARQIIERIAIWPGANDEKRLAQWYQELGRSRFVEEIPLPEVIRSLHVLKHCTLDLVRSEGFARTPVEIYAEEELEYLIGNYFDRLVYHVAQGYWAAMQQRLAESAPRAHASGEKKSFGQMPDTGWSPI